MRPHATDFISVVGSSLLWVSLGRPKGILQQHYIRLSKFWKLLSLPKGIKGRTVSQLGNVSQSALVALVGASLGFGHHGAQGLSPRLDSTVDRLSVYPCLFMTNGIYRQISNFISLISISGCFFGRIDNHIIHDSCNIFFLLASGMSCASHDITSTAGLVERAHRSSLGGEVLNEWAATLEHKSQKLHLVRTCGKIVR